MECRICFDSGSEPLISPCKCTGSMKWVHKSCLQQWINHKKDYKCPVCKEKFNIDRNNVQGIISYILDSDTITTIITVLVCLLILNYSVYYGIRPNTIALTFFMVIFERIIFRNLLDMKKSILIHCLRQCYYIIQII